MKLWSETLASSIHSSGGKRQTLSFYAHDNNLLFRRKANNIISLRASITFGCTLSGLTCMCVMRFSSDELWYKRINVTRVQHLNLCTHSSSQHYTGQLKSTIIYSFYYLFTYKLFQFGGRMFQDGDLKTWTALETKLETWSEIYRNGLEMKRIRSQGHAIIFS